MKHRFFLLLCPVFIAYASGAQSFGSIGTEWYYSEHNGGAGPPNSEFVHYKSVSDTVIKGITTHKITQQYFRYNGELDLLKSIYVYQKSDTVFMYSFEKGRFLKLYIFNGAKGDTLTLDNLNDFSGNKPIYRLRIDSVIVFKIDGISLKQYKTENINSSRSYSFIDRIGGEEWFFPYGTAIPFPEAGGPIRCYKDGQIDTNFQKIACDRSIFSIEKISKPAVVELFPNPVNGFLTIRAKEGLEKFELYDMAGKLIRSTTSLVSDLSDLADGLYFAKIHLHSGVISERKIVKSGQ